MLCWFYPAGQLNCTIAALSLPLLKELHWGLLHPWGGCSVEICSMWDPWAAGGQPAPPDASPQATEELLLHAWSTSWPPSVLALVTAGLVFTSLSQLLSQSSFFFFFFFFPFLNLLSPRCKQHHLQAWLWAAAGPFGASWNWPLFNSGQLLDSSHRSHPM